MLLYGRQIDTADALSAIRRGIFDNHSSGKKKRKSGNSREVFHKSKLSEFILLGGFDIPYFALVMLLLAIGLVMLLSASYPTAYFNGENSYSFFIKQAAFAVVGVVAILVMSKIDYKIFKKYANIIYFRCIRSACNCSVLSYGYAGCRRR